MEQHTIDPLTRERIFGLYAGQEVMTSDVLYNDDEDHFEKPVLSMSKYSGVFLKVKPLWQLTKEDALHIMNIFYPIPFLRIDESDPSPTEGDINIHIDINKTTPTWGLTEVTMRFRNNKYRILINTLTARLEFEPESQQCRVTNNIYLDGIDSLRARGYALPAFGYNVDELFDKNIFWWPGSRWWLEEENDNSESVVEEVASLENP